MLRSLFIGLCLIFITHSTVHANALAQFSQLKNAGLLVVDSKGNKLLSDNRNRTFIPASTTKIVTAWLALNRWGEQHRFSTFFYYDAQQAKLWVKGSGDPFLVSEELTTIITQLKQRGIRHINTLALDTSLFQSGIVLPGTSRTNNPYDAVPSALAANFNTVNLKKVNGKIRSAEKQTPLTPIAKSLARGFKKNKLRVNTGHNPKKAEQYFGELFLALLKVQGITHNNHIIFAKSPNTTPFYQHQNSKTLGDMIRPMMKYSTNFIANQLAIMMTTEHLRRPVTTSDIQQYMEGTLRASFNWKNFSFREGAGLSRSNRISPVQLVELLENFHQWRHLLPEVETGVFAKSGTLKKVSTLAGYIVDKGEWKPFALMMNQSVPYKLRNRIAKELRKTL